MISNVKNEVGKVASQTSQASSAQDNSADTSEEKFNQIVSQLNDAVSFSTKALEFIEKFTRGEKADAFQAPELKDNVNKALSQLKESAATAEVIRENIAASEARIEDLDVAQMKADSIGFNIQMDAKKAIDAHAGLDPKRVMELLAE